MLLNAKVMDASPYDISQVCKISDREFGKGYIQPDSFETATSKTIFRVVKSPNDGVLGYCYAVLVNKNEMIDNYKITAIPENAQNDDVFGIVKTIVVSPEFRLQGIGTALFKDCLHNLSERKASSAMAVAWIGRIGVNLGGLLNRQKFKQLETIKNYWYDDSIRRGFTCAECGAPPCRCSAAIFCHTF